MVRGRAYPTGALPSDDGPISLEDHLRKSAFAAGREPHKCAHHIGAQ